METPVTMATEKIFNNFRVWNQTKFMFGTEVFWDKRISVFILLLWKPMLPCQQRKSLITFVSEIQQSSYLVKRSPGTKAFQFYAVAMETLVTMATEKILNNFCVRNQTKFIFTTVVSWDTSISVFIPLLWKLLLPWQQRKFIITFVSEIGQSTYFVQSSSEVRTTLCLLHCWGNHCYHGNREKP